MLKSGLWRHGLVRQSYSLMRKGKYQHCVHFRLVEDALHSLETHISASGHCPCYVEPLAAISMVAVFFGDSF